MLVKPLPPDAALMRGVVWLEAGRACEPTARVMAASAAFLKERKTMFMVKGNDEGVWWV